MRPYAFILGLLLLVSCTTQPSEPVTIETKDTLQVADTVPQEVRVGIKMTSIGGVYQIPCYVNGVKMNFIVDTGAANVTISLTEAAFLAKNGYLSKEDVIGESYAKLADGKVIPNTEINLHSIEIEGIVITDVKAVIIENTTAPLLLGQSVLKKLGKIEMVGDSLFLIRKGEKPVEVKQSNITQTVKIEVPDEKWYDNILAICGYDGKFNAYLNAAWSAYNSDLPELAISYCRKATDLKEDYKAYGLLGYIYFMQFDKVNNGRDDFSNLNNEAYNNLKDYSTKNENKEDIHFSNGGSLSYNDLMLLLSRSCFIKNYYDEAMEITQEIYLRNPNDTYAMNLISLIYSKQNNYDLAKTWAQKILDTHKDDRNGYFRLAWLAKRMGRYQEAIRYYEKCLEINNNDKSVLNNLGEIYREGSLRQIEYGNSLLKRAARLGNPHAQKTLLNEKIEW